MNQAAFNLAQRMDELALLEPDERSWEALFKQLRHEVGAMCNVPDDAVVAILTVDEARALLCHRTECDMHPPEMRGSAHRKLAAATRATTVVDQ